MASVEVGRGKFRSHDRDVTGQRGVQRLRCALRRRAAVDVDADDVAERVHACVGAAGHCEVLVLREN
jgi:hypothetical protein